MSSRTLSYLSDEATQEENVADVLTPALTVVPEQGELLRLLNNVPTGAADGLPIFADFRDSNGNPLSTSTTLILRAVRPGMDEPTAVSVAETNIAPWNRLDIGEQRNEENIDAVKVELKGDRVNIRDKDVLRVDLDGPDVIDWTQSELYFARKGVTRESYQG
jgi:hypothetical protein